MSQQMRISAERFGQCAPNFFPGIDFQIINVTALSVVGVFQYSLLTLAL